MPELVVPELVVPGLVGGVKVTSKAVITGVVAPTALQE